MKDELPVNCRKCKYNHISVDMCWCKWNRDSEYGWEIDHINPVSNNGLDNIGNLQPLNWKNNADKGDKLDWTCP